MTSVPGDNPPQPQQVPENDSVSYTLKFGYDDRMLQDAVARVTVRLKRETLEMKQRYEGAVAHLGRLKSPGDIQREVTRIEDLRHEWKKSRSKLREHFEKLEELHKDYDKLTYSFNTVLKDNVKKHAIAQTWDYINKMENSLAKVQEEPVERALTIRL